MEHLSKPQKIENQIAIPFRSKQKVMERKMKNTHPGQILYMKLVEGRNLTISKISELLGITPTNSSNIVNLINYYPFGKKKGSDFISEPFKIIS